MSTPSIKRLFSVKTLAALCVLLILPELFIHRHAEFHVEGHFAFYAQYGLIVGSLLVLLAVVWGKIVKRDEDYYDR